MTNDTPLDGLCRDRRGVSQALGVVLVVAIVLMGVVSIVGFGIVGISDVTTDVSDTAVERDLTGFAAAVDRATVHSDTAAGTTAVDLSLTGMTESRERIAVDGDAGGLTLNARADGTETELVNTSLGIVEYENPDSDTRIAYQSGLVFLASDAGEGVSVVRQNEFAHRSEAGVETLVVHITQVTGDARFDRRIELSAAAAENLHPDVLVGASPGGATELVLRVDSAYSAGWERALRAVFPPARTEFSRQGSELEVVYAVPEEGLFLHAYRHRVALDG